MKKTSASSQKDARATVAALTLAALIGLAGFYAIATPPTTPAVDTTAVPAGTNGALIQDMNAGGHNITNAATVSAATVAASSNLTLGGTPVLTTTGNAATAAYATSAGTASNAVSASNAATAAYATSAGTASNAATATYATSAGTITGPVAATNLVGTVTNNVSAASVTSALFTGNASALTNFPSAAIMGLGTAATNNAGAFDANGAAAAVLASSLQKSNNLSDVSNTATARSNLGLGSAATQASGFFLQTTNNLSDLASASTARSNLGLGTLSTSNSVTTSNITGLGTGVPAVLAATVSGTGSIVGTSNASMTTPQISDYPTKYLFSILQNADGTGLNFYASATGYQISRIILPNGVAVFDPTYFRDPRLMKIGNTFWLTYDLLNQAGTHTNNQIGLAWSYDLVNWTVCSTPNWSSLFTGAQNCVGNGGFFYDATPIGTGNYYVYFSTACADGATPLTETTYVVQFIPGSTPGSFSFGTPTQITFSPTRNFASVQKVFQNPGGGYTEFLQSTGTSGAGSTDYVEVSGSTTCTGTMTLEGTNNFSGIGTSVEGNTAVELSNGTVVSYQCAYGGGGITYATSTNVLTTTNGGTWSLPLPMSNFNTTSLSTEADWIDVVPLTDVTSIDALCNLMLAGGYGAVVGNQGFTDVLQATSNTYPYHAVFSYNGGVDYVNENPNTGSNATTSLAVGQNFGSNQAGDLTYFGSGKSGSSNTVIVNAESGASGGLMLRSQAVAPIIFQVDGVEKGRFSTSGDFLLGSTNDVPFTENLISLQVTGTANTGYTGISVLAPNTQSGSQVNAIVGVTTTNNTDVYFQKGSTSNGNIGGFGLYNQTYGMAQFGSGDGGIWGLTNPTDDGTSGWYVQAGNIKAASGNIITSTGSFNSGAIQTTSNGSSGTVICSMPFAGSSYKKVMFTLTNFNGTATYASPTNFSSTNVQTSPNLTGIVTITGTNTFSISTSTNTTTAGSIDGY